MSDKELMENADKSLQRLDLNNDGYITYLEYITVIDRDHPK